MKIYFSFIDEWRGDFMVADIGQIDAVEDIDWSSQFTWVQNHGRVRVIDDLGQTVTIEAFEGEVLAIPRKQLERDYRYSEYLQCFNPVYRPVKAHCLENAVTLAGHEDDGVLEPGDALVMNSDGSIEVVRREKFFANYLAVSNHTTEKPPIFPYVH